MNLSISIMTKMLDKIKVNILKRLIVLLICITIVLGTGVGLVKAITPGECPFAMVTENYIVQTGDTLDKIVEIYIKKNTWGKREFSEFKFGIQELNPQLFDRDVIQGETLIINYWINNKNREDE